ncbi:unnamed protein product [Urochloa decumbens]|uniref:Uncharacterized protein n=1 Tax=Urochloa decumbens TaxID=240449 RepID=A0ABC9GTH1_9POAL
MWTENPLVRDAGAAVLTGVAAAVVLRFWEEVANRSLLDQEVTSKPVLCCSSRIPSAFAKTIPFLDKVQKLFLAQCSSDDVFARFLAPLIILINIIKVTVIGLGLVKDEGVVNSMTRHGDSRELLKGPLYYACAITLATIVFWRTSPISIAVICNLCAGDGVADIVGRRLGQVKLPHNPEKSYAGSIAMFMAGFIASVLYMCYFSIFGFVEKSWTMVGAFGVTSLAAAVVESLRISTRLDDNLTVPLASVLVGALVFYLIAPGNLCCMTSEDGSSISAIVR